MTLYNVAVAVVALIEAGSEEAAMREARARLDGADFVVYDGPPLTGFSVFESEMPA